MKKLDILNKKDSFRYREILESALEYARPLNNIKEDFKIPKIENSLECPDRKSGSLDKEEVEEKLKLIREKYIKLHPGDADLIKEMTDYNTKNNLFSQDSFDSKEWLRDLVIELRKLFRQEKFSYKVLGTYSHSENKIVIYVNNHKDEDGIATESIRQTIAHEMFHAIHYYLAPKTFVQTSDEAMIVREALADYFAYYYMNSCMGNEPTFKKLCFDMAQKRRKAWEQNLSFNWPYSYARFFNIIIADKDIERLDGKNKGLCYKSICCGKLSIILDISKYDMEIAYKVLVPDEIRNI